MNVTWMYIVYTEHRNIVFQKVMSHMEPPTWEKVPLFASQHVSEAASPQSLRGLRLCTDTAVSVCFSVLQYTHVQ